MSTEPDFTELLGNLARQLSETTETVNELASNVEAHDGTLDSITSGLDKLTSTISALSKQNKGGDDKDPEPKILWLDLLDDTKRGDAYDDLRAWTEHILLPTWAEEASAVLPPCWPQHPQIIVELQALCACWKDAYDPKTGGNPGKAAEWLDRWRPNAFARLRTVTQSCRDSSTHVGGKPAAKSLPAAWEAAKRARPHDRVSEPSVVTIPDFSFIEQS